MHAFVYGRQLNVNKSFSMFFKCCSFPVQQAKKSLLKIVNKIIEERKMAIEKTEKNELSNPNDVIDVLLRDTGESDEMQQHRLPLDFISGNIIEMMIPGEETVPTAMTLAVKFLIDNPVALAHLVVRILYLNFKI